MTLDPRNQATLDAIMALLRERLEGAQKAREGGRVEVSATLDLHRGSVSGDPLIAISRRISLDTEAVEASHSHR